MYTHVQCAENDFSELGTCLVENIIIFCTLMSCRHVLYAIHLLCRFIIVCIHFACIVGDALIKFYSPYPLCLNPIMDMRFLAIA